MCFPKRLCQHVSAECFSNTSSVMPLPFLSRAGRQPSLSAAARLPFRTQGRAWKMILSHPIPRSENASLISAEKTWLGGGILHTAQSPPGAQQHSHVLNSTSGFQLCTESTVISEQNWFEVHTSNMDEKLQTSGRQDEGPVWA